jgi:hypothetical protein
MEGNAREGPNADNGDPHASAHFRLDGADAGQGGCARYLSGGPD